MLSLEYCAGLFDGEGHVSIDHLGRVSAGVTQKPKAILDQLQAQFCYGSIHKKEFGCHTWIVTGKRNVTHFLSEIRPHLFIKRDEVDLAIKAANLIRENNLGCNPIPVELAKRRKELRNGLLSLRDRHGIRKGTIAREQKRRHDILECQSGKCKMCNADLSVLAVFDVIISRGIAVCRSCHPKRYTHEFKPVSKEIIENLIAEGKTQNEICSIVGVNRSSLYQKMKKYNIANGYCWPCGKLFQKTAGRQSYCSDECNRVGTATSRLRHAEEYRGKKQENDRAFYLRHREKRIAKVKAYYEANAERIKAYAREYHRNKKAQGGSNA